MKRPDSMKNNLLPLVAVAAIGMLGIDTFYRLFIKPPDGGKAETTVSLAIGKARPWSTEEQQVLTRLLPACRQQASEGKLNDMVDCWTQAARKSGSNSASKEGQSDETVLTGLLDRAGYKR